MKQTLLIITLFIGFGNVYAQENNPSKEETFNFIIDILPNFTTLGYDDLPIKIISMNKSSFTIELESGSRKKSCYCTVSFSLKDTKDISEGNDYVKLYFNTASARGYDACFGESGNWNKSYLKLESDNQKAVERLSKAIKHFIKISGNKVDKTLFD